MSNNLVFYKPFCVATTLHYNENYQSMVSVGGVA